MIEIWQNRHMREKLWRWYSRYNIGVRICWALDLSFTPTIKVKFLLQQRITTPDQQNWVAKLLGYNFDICYKPGRENRAADALSRRAEDGEFTTAISEPIWLQGAQLVEEIHSDAEIQKLTKECLDNQALHPGYVVRHDVLYYKDRLVIPKTSKFIPILLKEFHRSVSGGHSGYYRTYRRLAANIYWSGMIASVKQFVKECDVCQRCKASSYNHWIFPTPFGNIFLWISSWDYQNREGLTLY